MHKSERFTFGTITLPSGVLPSIEEVRDAIERMSNDPPDATCNDTQIHRNSANAVVCRDDHESYSYCHFQYRAVLSGDDATHTTGTESSRVQPWHVRSRVFYFENGQFAVQPMRGVSETWFPTFLARITNTDVKDEFWFYSSGESRSDTQQPHHIVSPRGPVSRVPAGDGPVPSVSTPPAADERPTSSSAGDPADLLAEATQTGTAESHRTLHERSPDAAFAPGTVVATWNEADWPNDVEESRRATEIHRQIVPYLQSHS